MNSTDIENEFKKQLNRWNKSINQLSGNLTTNAYMPNNIKQKLLTENINLITKLKLETIYFPKVTDIIDDPGLNILSGIQNIKKGGHLTVYRAIRFPTIKRIYEAIYKNGYIMSNYEQERILNLYKNKEYIQKREKIMNNIFFWTQPQERVVNGLPVFSLVNDAIQIHKAYRAETDKVLIIAIHVPFNLIKSKKIKLIANTAIDFNHTTITRDIEINNFVDINKFAFIDYKALRVKGIDLYEMYIKGLPMIPSKINKYKIQQEFYLLDLEKVNKKKYNTFSSEDLKRNEYFLHGFFGDQNLFGRSTSEYIPYNCRKVNKSPNN